MDVTQKCAVPAGGVDVAAFFDRRVERYDDDYDMAGWGGHVLRARLRTTVALLGDGPGDLLDVGMGPGRLCEQMARRGWTVSGIDLSPEMVRRAQVRLPDAAARLREGRMDALPFANGSFDAVAATGVLEYAESAPDAVNELARVLRPGGLAVLSIPNRYSWHGFSRRVSDPVARSVKHACLGVQSTKARHDRLPSPRGFVRLLAERGLRVREVRYSGALLIPAPIDRLVPTASERLGLTFERRARLRSVLATQFVVSAIKAHAAPASGNGEAP